MHLPFCVIFALEPSRNFFHSPLFSVGKARPFWVIASPLRQVFLRAKEPCRSHKFPPAPQHGADPFNDPPLSRGPVIGDRFFQNLFYEINPFPTQAALRRPPSPSCRHTAETVAQIVSPRCRSFLLVEEKSRSRSLFRPVCPGEWVPFLCSSMLIFAAVAYRQMLSPSPSKHLPPLLPSCFLNDLLSPETMRLLTALPFFQDNFPTQRAPPLPPSFSRS